MMRSAINRKEKVKFSRIIGIVIAVHIIFLGFALILASQNNQIPSIRIEGALSQHGRLIKEKHPAWSNSICNDIAMHKLSIGMSGDQVVESWGWPYRVNRSILNNVINEEWVMTNKSDSEHLYFSDGILQKIEQKEQTAFSHDQ